MTTTTAPQPPVDPSARRRGRIYLLLIIAAFSLPLLLAWALHDRWRPDGSVHHGELLQPAVPLAELDTELSNINLAANSDAADSSQDNSDGLLQHRWTLAYLAPTDCSQACRDALYKIRQIRLALGKNIDRARTLALLPQMPDEPLQAWLRDEHTAMNVAVAPSVADALRRPFDNNTASTQPSASSDPHSIYLLDPLGNLLMRYDSDVEPKGIITDLKRLLKYSKLG